MEAIDSADKGAFGEVYRCRLIALPLQPMVLKLVRETREAKDFERELATLSLFHHPRIIRFFGTYEALQPVRLKGLVMQRADGNLRDYLYANASQQLEAKLMTVLRASKQVAEGLQVRISQPGFLRSKPVDCAVKKGGAPPLFSQRWLMADL
jgi:serine/threonine protein kinase